MKNILCVSLLALVMSPVAISAHTGDTTTLDDPGFMMMQQVEDQALGDELHEEMEELMIKMMSGDLSQNETDRMVELMGQYPGAHSMMMGRMMGMGPSELGFNSFNNNSMMGHGFNGFFMILFWIFVIVGTIALVKYAMGNTRSGKRTLDILKERYAKGEISKDEFESKKKELQ